MQKFIKNLPSLKKNNHPVVYAAKLHKEFVFIHPFVDGNGRVVRLLMNVALMQAGYIIAIIPPLKRSEYISALEKAHKNGFIVLGGITAESSSVKYLLELNVDGIFANDIPALRRVLLRNNFEQPLR